MKITSLKENLHRPLTLLSRYISSRPALPVLANILIEASDDRVVMSATNLDITVKATIPAKIEEPGKITVPARLLSELIATLPAGNITFSTTDTQLMVTTGDTQSELNSIPAADYPVLPNFNQDNAIPLPINLLNTVSQKVLFAAATDEARPVLTTLMVATQDDSIIFVSTDGFRLSEAVRVEKGVKLDINKPLLLPAKIIGEMIKIGNDSKQEKLWIDITTQSNQIAMKVGDIEYFSKLIDAEFPDYKRIIPNEFVTEVEIDSEELLQAVKLSSVFAKEAGSLVKFQINPENNTLTVGAQSAALGQNQSVINSQIEGEDMIIAFNAKYLLDALNAFTNGKLHISFKGPLAPMMIRDDSQAGYRHIIMPIKIEG